jgi:hypothetical protein
METFIVFLKLKWDETKWWLLGIPVSCIMFYLCCRFVTLPLLNWLFNRNELWTKQLGFQYFCIIIVTVGYIGIMVFCFWGIFEWIRSNWQQAKKIVNQRKG